MKVELSRTSDNFWEPTSISFNLHPHVLDATEKPYFEALNAAHMAAAQTATAHSQEYHVRNPEASQMYRDNDEILDTELKEIHAQTVEPYMDRRDTYHRLIQTMYEARSEAIIEEVPATGPLVFEGDDAKALYEGVMYGRGVLARQGLEAATFFQGIEYIRESEETN